MKEAPVLGQPTAAARPYLRAGAAIAIVLVMLLSGSAVAFFWGTGSAQAASPASGGRYISHTPIETGIQLQKDAYLQNPGTPLTNLQNASVQSPVSGNQQVTFTVGFQMRNAQALADIITAQQTQGSSQYHHWLTTSEEAQLFGPDPATVQNTINYFTSLGLTLGTRGSISLSFSGTADQVNAAFKTSLVNVQYGSGKFGLVNAMPLALPAPIATGISTVNGLDTATVAHPTNGVDPTFLSQFAPQIPPEDQQSFQAGLVHALYSYSANESTAYNFTNHAFLWFRYYSHRAAAWRTYQTVTPAALSLMYQAMPLLNRGINGNSTGNPITIAIVMGGGINPGDMQGFSKLVWNNPNQILNRLVAVPVDRQYGLNGTLTYTDGDSGEMALDIEFSSTMAPGARIMPVYGPFLGTNILDDQYATIDRMNPVPNIVTNSWGGDEVSWPNLYGPNWANALTMHDYFMLLSAKGATVMASSADGGGFDKANGIMSGSFPATDPYVFSVDGVRTSAAGTGGAVFPAVDSLGNYTESIYSLPNETVHVDKTLGIQSQSYWYEPLTNRTLFTAPPSGSGGFGTSYWFTQPWFQHGIGVPDVGRALGSSVAAEADFNQTIFFDGYFEWLYGGTSFACPTTAGELALIDDYMLHSTGSPQAAYLGVADYPVFNVANAYYNGNVSLVPFYDVTNGTSYWGNFGAKNGYEWPPGQVFPQAADGKYTYGNTNPGFDFPTGWGTLNVYNFALDLLQLYQMPGSFQVVNVSLNHYDPVTWGKLQLNRTYTLHVNSSSAIAATNPVVGVEFFGDNGVRSTIYPSLTATLLPSPGFDFTIDTTVAPFGPLFTPGVVILTLGNQSISNLGFAYSYIAKDIPAGNLTVTVIQPGTSGEVGGTPQFNMFLGFSPPTVVPACCTFPNTFAVLVTLNGRPVYDAQVLASVTSTNLLAFSNTRAEQATESFGNPNYESPTIVSSSLTNLTGVALVYTWNVIAPTTFFVNATYGSNKGGTNYQILPGPNVRTTDAYGGRMSNFNVIQWILYALHQTVSNRNIALWEPNALNQTALWNLMYGWQGERLNVSVNNYTGGLIGGAHVWLGGFDAGRETRFERFQASGGVFGVTNYSGTSGTTSGPSPFATIQIPDNMSDTGGLNGPTAQGQTAGLGFIAVDVAGSVNRTFQYTESCTPNLPNPNVLITCEFNNSYQRNYTADPILILPNPVNLTVQTPSRLPLDFFSLGANVSFEANVTLPNVDPIAGFNTAYNWPAGPEHITQMSAWVDGQKALDLSPLTPPFWQKYTAFGNLSNNYVAGAHNLTLVVNDSAGHTFTQTKRFVIGGVNITNIGSQNIYTVVPKVVNWTLDIPADQVFNYTYNQSFDLRYVTGGCGGLKSPCPTVVNLSERVHDGVVNYQQSINLTLMGLEHFYSGNGGQYPSGQYQIIVWLNENRTDGNSIAAQVNTFLIFSSVHGKISGPGANATVPLGNVTLAYNYSGGYIQNATLSVFPQGSTVPVFTTGAVVPAVGEQERGGSATWVAVQTGTYQVVLTLGTPYAGNYTASEWINVTNPNGLVYLNQSLGAKPLISLSSAQLATILALVGVIIGMFVGLIAAPALRPTAGGRAAGSSPKPWDEGRPGPSASGVGDGSPVGNGSPGGLSCPICHEPATNEFSLHQHQQVVHGIEE
ncbi:MAG TPA: protease pro-enzyme activation domain-containing protein [Thermoplasmata archaeon]|nr:protease pro-enzyme activation domain-containing protein [Thermoplasmata archaeon]